MIGRSYGVLLLKTSNKHIMQKTNEIVKSETEIGKDRKKFYKNPELKWQSEYTIAFLIMCAVTFSLQIFYLKSFVYTEYLTGDGLVQHFNFLVYYGSWLRQILRNIFIDHTWSIPTYDLSFGLGDDIVTSLNYYALGEPWNIFAVFFTPQNTEILYNLLVIVRLYLAGLAFYRYCLYHGYDSRRILPGAMIYVFSFYTVVLSVLHPFFLNPLIFFPLILLGIDKIFIERKPMLFILSCALAAADNFYFFYMMTVLMFIYGVLRYVQNYREEFRIISVLKKALEFMLYYVLSIMIAAPIFLPSAAAVLSSSRVGSRQDIPLLYELFYYVKLPLAFLNSSADHYVHLGYGIVGGLAVLLLFFKTDLKEKAILKIAFLLGCVFCIFPFFGHVLNGFSYVTNRWIWAYCMVVSLIVVAMMPMMEGFRTYFDWMILGGTALSIVPVFYFRMSTAGITKEAISVMIAAVCISAAMAVLILWACRRMRCQRRIGYLLIIMLNVFLSMFSFYSPYGGNDIGKHGDLGQAWDDLNDSPFIVTREMKANELEGVRIDTSDLYVNGVRTNSALQYDVNSVSFYSSMVNESTTDLMRDLRLPSSYEHKLIDLDSRAMLLSLIGVKYDIVATGGEDSLPYGYTQKTAEMGGYSMYKTGLSLPMAYWYDSIMEESEYNTLSALKKQQALLQTAVPQTEWVGAEHEVSMLKAENLLFDDMLSECEIAEVHGLTFSPNKLEVSEPKAWLILKTAPARETERYFSFEGVTYVGANTTTIEMAEGTKKKQLEIKSEVDNAYVGKEDFLCNFGYAQEHGNEYKITFSAPGTYTYKKIEILDQPLGHLEEWVYARKETPVNYVLGEDSVSVELQPQEAGLLYLSIPYSNGWKARVDGQKQEIVKTNNFGIGVFLGPGDHTVELEYHTPYFGLGLMMFLVGLLGCVITWLLGRRTVR